MQTNFNIIIWVLLVATTSSCSSKPTIIDGYQDKISYFPTDTVHVYLKANKKQTHTVNLFDINGNTIDKISCDLSPQNLNDTSYWWKKGFNYQKTFDYIPSNLKSGVYYFQNSSPFIVKNPTKKNKIVIVYPSNTVNAYNKRGGRSSYTNPMGAILSFKRPANIQSYTQPFLEWLPKQNLHVDYICDRDLEDYKNIAGYKKIVIPGHSEYWTKKARNNFARFVSNGGDAIILSGNTMWWQIRYAQNKLICFKSVENDSLVIDALKTIQWDNTLLNYPIKNSIGVDFTNGGYGLKKDSGWDGFVITQNHPLFKRAGIKIGDTLHCPSTEFDGVDIRFKNGYPTIKDTSFYRYELLGYDIGVSGYGKKAFATFIIMQKTKKSGVIINTSTTDWCSKGFTGKDGDKIKRLTLEMMKYDKLNPQSPH